MSRNGSWHCSPTRSASMPPRRSTPRFPWSRSAWIPCRRWNCAAAYSASSPTTLGGWICSVEHPFQMFSPGSAASRRYLLVSHRLAQRLRAHIGPALLNVGDAVGAGVLAEPPPPAGRHVDAGGPQAVLLLVVGQDVERSVVVVKRIGTHRFSQSADR